MDLTELAARTAALHADIATWGTYMTRSEASDHARDLLADHLEDTDLDADNLIFDYHHTPGFASTLNEETVNLLRLTDAPPRY